MQLLRHGGDRTWSGRGLGIPRCRRRGAIPIAAVRYEHVPEHRTHLRPPGRCKQGVVQWGDIVHPNSASEPSRDAHAPVAAGLAELGQVLGAQDELDLTRSTGQDEHARDRVADPEQGQQVPGRGGGVRLDGAAQSAQPTTQHVAHAR